MPQKGLIPLTESGAETDLVKKVFGKETIQSFSVSTDKRIYLAGYIDPNSKSSYIGLSRESASNLFQEPLKDRERRKNRVFKFKAETIAHAIGICFNTIWKTIKENN